MNGDDDLPCECPNCDSALFRIYPSGLIFCADCGYLVESRLAAEVVNPETLH